MRAKKARRTVRAKEAIAGREARISIREQRKNVARSESFLGSSR